MKNLIWRLLLNFEKYFSRLNETIEFGAFFHIFQILAVQMKQLNLAPLFKTLSRKVELIFWLVAGIKCHDQDRNEAAGKTKQIESQ